MPQYVLRSGGISVGRSGGQMAVPLQPALPGQPPTLVEMTEEEAAQINAGHDRALLGTKRKPPPLQLLSEYEAELAGEKAKVEAIERARRNGVTLPENLDELEAAAREYEKRFDAREADLRKREDELLKLTEESQTNLAKAHAELEKKWKEIEAREAAVKKAEDAAKAPPSDKPKDEKQHGKAGK